MNPFVSSPSGLRRSRRLRGNQATANDDADSTVATRPKKVKKKPRTQTKNLRIRKKINEKNRRSRIKANPKLYEAHLEKDRQRKRKAVEEGKLKLVGDMSPREYRIHRSKAAARLRKHRMKKKLQAQAQLECHENIAAQDLRGQQGNDLNSLSSGIAQQGPLRRDLSPSTPPSSSRIQQSTKKIHGAAKRAINRLIASKRSAAMQEEILRLKRKVHSLQKAKNRADKKMKSPELSPRSAVKRLCGKRSVSSPVRKRLLEGFALKAEMRSSLKSLKSYKEKQIMGRLVSGRILKHYRLLHTMRPLFSLRSMAANRKVSVAPSQRLEYYREQAKKSEGVRKELREFFLSNQASTECPGKKQGKIYDGEQRQRRYLTGNLKELHKSYLSKKESTRVSYATFRRNKPEWVVKPVLTGRDTCLCRVCENYKFLFKASKSTGILNFDSCKDFIESLCCTETTTECLLRQCQKCTDKRVDFLGQNDEKPVMYNEWITTTEQKYSVKSKKEIPVKIAKKVSKYCTIAELKQLINSNLLSYMEHVGIYCHQMKASELVLQSLESTEMAMLMDWSMNYCCKYAKEIQSVHFGGSHAQIALHTGRIYLNGGKSKSFCTLSEITRHDPRAIAAHLQPILDRYLRENPQVTKVYFMSDGPTSQYKNRDLYFLVTQYLVNFFPQVTEIEWIFSGSGHGKGEADGVGGTTKRTADNAVAHGRDVHSLENFFTIVAERCPSIFYRIVTEVDIKKVDAIEIPQTKAIAGTRKIHHWVWHKKYPERVVFKILFCLSCHKTNSSGVCQHYMLSKKVWAFPAKDSRSKPNPKPKLAKQAPRKEKPVTQRQSKRLMAMKK